MGENSQIEWTDHTWTIWSGYEEVSEGCDHCYAKALAKRNPGNFGVWGPDGTRIVRKDEYWNLPLKWNAAAKSAGVRQRVFVNSTSDFFEDWGNRPMLDHHGHTILSPDGLQRITMQDCRVRAFEFIDECDWLDFLFVTKRPENILRFWTPRILAATAAVFPGMPGPLGTPIPCVRKTDYRENVWLLTSVEDQAAANTRIPWLLKCRDLSPVLGLSCEPLLGQIWFREEHLKCLRWIIGGYESGPGSRCRHPDIIRSIRDQCQAAGVPFLFKQWGDWYPSSQRSFLNDVSAIKKIDRQHEFGDPEPSHYHIGKKLAGRLLDGCECNEFPMTGGRA